MDSPFSRCNFALASLLIHAPFGRKTIPKEFRYRSEGMQPPFWSHSLTKKSTIMAKITPIDIIKGVSGKFGGGNSKEYFATNKCSYTIHFAKRVNPYTGPATEKQLEIRKRFKSKQKAVIAWLRANRATADRPATEAYLIAYDLKRRYGFSNINQVVYKYLNENLEVVLPNIGNNAVEGGLGE